MSNPIALQAETYKDFSNLAIYIIVNKFYINLFFSLSINSNFNLSNKNSHTPLFLLLYKSGY